LCECPSVQDHSPSNGSAPSNCPAALRRINGPHANTGPQKLSRFSFVRWLSSFDFRRSGGHETCPLRPPSGQSASLEHVAGLSRAIDANYGAVDAATFAVRPIDSPDGRQIRQTIRNCPTGQLPSWRPSAFRACDPRRRPADKETRSAETALTCRIKKDDWQHSPPPPASGERPTSPTIIAFWPARFPRISGIGLPSGVEPVRDSRSC